MLKKILILVLVGAIGLVILRPFGVRSGIGPIDSSLTRLNSSLAGYAEVLNTDNTGGGPGRAKELTVALSALVDGAADRFDSPSGVRGISSDPTDTREGEESSEQMETFVVRVGLFGDLANAENVVTTLRAHEFEARIYEVAGLHAVGVGPFDQAQSEVAAKVISEATGLSPLVVRREAGQRF